MAGLKKSGGGGCLPARDPLAVAIKALGDGVALDGDPDALFNLILTHAVSLVGGKAGGFYLVDGEAGEVRLVASRPRGEKPIRAGKGSESTIADPTGQMATALKAGRDGFALKRLGTNRVAATVATEGKLLGLLVLAWEGERRFGAVEKRSLAAYAQVAAKFLSAATAIRELEGERDLLENILGGTPNGVIALDQNRRVIMMNKAARRYILPERMAEAVKGNPVERYLPQPEFAAKLADVLAKRSDLEKMELNLGEGTGKKNYSLKIFNLSRGPLNGATIILQDLTEQRKLDEEVARMGRVASIGQLAAGVAHEIRNPLTGIAITLDILRDQEKLTRGGTEMIEDISREIDRLETLIRGLLDFARPQDARRRPMRLAKALEWHRTFQEQCRKKGVAFSLELEANPKIEGDPERLKQLFLNLALNALDATEAGGKVTIRATLDASTRLNERVKVEVRDTGKGMDAQTVQRIFDPFFTTKNEGTGLGLSIAHSIVGQHAGAMDVASTPGIGTTFTVNLPCHEAE